MTKHPRSPLAACSWSLQPDGIDQLVELTAKTGLQALQLALTPLIDDPARWKDTRKALDAANIAVVSGMMQTREEDYTTLETIRNTGGIRPDEHWAANLEHAGKVASLAAEFELDLVTFHAGFMPEDESSSEHGILVDRLRQLATLFDEHGIILGLETGQESAATLLHTLEAIGSSNLKVNFDPANMILYGMGDPVDALQTLSAHVVQIHIKDANPAATPGDWGEEVVVGSGEVDWQSFFEVVNKLGQLRLVIEREAGEQRIYDIIEAASVVDRFISQ